MNSLLKWLLNGEWLLHGFSEIDVYEECRRDLERTRAKLRYYGWEEPRISAEEREEAVKEHYQWYVDGWKDAIAKGYTGGLADWYRHKKDESDAGLNG